MLAGYPLQIVKRIGSGGMAVVYEALDTELGLPRAVKILDVGVTGIGGKDPVEELRREARVMAKLHQRCKENIVQVLFVGRTKDDAGALFIVMDRLVGCALKDLLTEKGALSWITAKQIVQHIAEALAVAHEEGIVHRDVKPANIYCDAPPERRGTRFVLLDFGIAAILDSSTNRFKGTFKYAAPEQTKSPAVLTAKTDMYSLGIVLYEMLAGRHPFAECANDGELVRAHRERIPTPLSTFVPGAPPALENLVASMLAKDPAARPASMRTIVDAVNAIHWDDRRELKPPSDTDTTVEELGTAVQNFEEEHRGPAVPIQLANTDPASPTAQAKRANGKANANATPGTLESPVGNVPVAFRQAQPVAVVEGKGPTTPKMNTTTPAAAWAPPAKPARPVTRRMPEVTEPMYDAPPLPKDAARARHVKNEATFDPVEVPMVWSRRSMHILLGAIVFAIGILGIGVLYRGRWTNAAAAASSSASVASAIVPSALPLAASTQAATPTATATTAPAPTPAVSDVAVSPSASAAAPVVTSPRPTTVATATPATPSASHSARHATSSTPPPAASHDPDMDLFKRELPGSGL